MNNEQDADAALRARDLAMQAACIRGYEIADEMMALLRATAAGEHAMISQDLLRRAATVLSFCAGFTAGAMAFDPERAILGRSADETGGVQ